MIDLDELERLERGATPAPWGQDVNCLHAGFCVPVAQFESFEPDGSNIPKADGIENAAFILSARNALPALIRELRAAREVINIAHEFSTWRGQSPVFQQRYIDAIVWRLDEYREACAAMKEGA